MVKAKIPPGGKPGKKMTVQGPDGQEHSFTIPKGKKAGDTWEVEVPVEEDEPKPAAGSRRASRRAAAAQDQDKEDEDASDPAPKVEGRRGRRSMAAAAPAAKDPATSESEEEVTAAEEKKKGGRLRKLTVSSSKKADSDESDAAPKSGKGGGRFLSRGRPKADAAKPTGEEQDDDEDDEGEEAESPPAVSGKGGKVSSRAKPKDKSASAAKQTGGAEEEEEEEGDEDRDPKPAAAAAAVRAFGRKGSGRFSAGGAGSESPRRSSTLALASAALAANFGRKLLKKADEADRDALMAFDRSTIFKQRPEVLDRLEGQLTSLTVHRTDELPHDSRIRHPVLCVHVINARTGHHVRKSIPDRPSTTAHETQSYVLPVMTKPFALGGASMRLPAWEEELLLAEDLTYLLHPQVYFFFELLDFATPGDAARGIDADRQAGWEPIAWAFLKVLGGPTGGEPGARRPNVPVEAGAPTHPMQLQLYRWQKSVRAPAASQPPVWGQFVAAGRRTYTSTLHVTVRPVPQPGQLAVKYPFRPMAAHHVEEGRLTYEQLTASTTRQKTPGGTTAGVSTALGGSISGGGMQRTGTSRDGGPCLLPNAVLHALPGGSMGCTALVLSPDGALLAAALADGERSLLALHEVASGRQRLLMHAHHRTVHELTWSADAERLVSVSADGTAKVWRPGLMLDGSVAPGEPEFTLPHPAFVYCGRLQKSSAFGASRGGEALLVTGANDCAVRLWDAASGELLATKLNHTARVNALVWSADGAQLYSGDADGVIKQWELVGSDLRMLHSIEKAELLGTQINSLSLHPTRRRLLIGTRAHQIISLDLRLLHLSMRYTGHACGEYHLRAQYSPDGRFVVAGSEDGALYAWSEETGAVVVDGQPVGFNGPLLQLAWCQHDHVLAVCSFGAQSPILVYFYDPTVAAATKAQRADGVPAGEAATATARLAASTGRGGARGLQTDNLAAPPEERMGAFGTATRSPRSPRGAAAAPAAAASVAKVLDEDAASRRAARLDRRNSRRATNGNVPLRDLGGDAENAPPARKPGELRRRRSQTAAADE